MLTLVANISVIVACFRSVSVEGVQCLMIPKSVCQVVAPLAPHDVVHCCAELWVKNWRAQGLSEAQARWSFAACKSQTNVVHTCRSICTYKHLCFGFWCVTNWKFKSLFSVSR
jgi:hypothetical protein